MWCMGDWRWAAEGQSRMGGEENMQQGIPFVNLFTSVLRFVLVLTHHPSCALKLLTPVEIAPEDVGFPWAPFSVTSGSVAWAWTAYWLHSHAQVTYFSAASHAVSGTASFCPDSLGIFAVVWESNGSSVKRDINTNRRRASVENFNFFFSFKVW